MVTREDKAWFATLGELGPPRNPEVMCSACGAEQPMWSTQTTDQGPRVCAPACWLGANLPAKERSGR